MLSYLLVLLHLFLATPIFSQEKEHDKSISVATLDNYAPFTFSTQKDTIKNEKLPPFRDSMVLKGFSWDIVRESFHSMGYTIDLNMYPWARAKAMVESGEIDALFPTTKTPERERTILYPGHEYYLNASPICIYTLKSKNLTYQGLSSLQGKTVGYRRSFSYGSQWDNSKNINKVDISSDLNGLYMLSVDRLDAVIANSVTTDKMLENKSMKELFTKHPTEIVTYEYLVVMKNNPKAHEIIKNFEEGMKKIKASGKYNEILKKWSKDWDLGILPISAK